LLPDGTRVEERVVDTNGMLDKGVEYAAEVEEVEFTLRQAMRTPAFWLLIAVPLVPSLAASVMGIHTIPFLTDIGIAPVRAAAMYSLMVAASLPARFVGGLVADRLRANHLRFLLCAYFFLQAVGIGIFLQNQTIAMIYVWFILYGLGMGLSSVGTPIIMARFFGRKAYGSIRGISSVFGTPIRIAGPVYAGWVYDTTGSYISVFVLLALSLAVSGVAALFILSPKPPTQVTDIHKIV
jgi:cyanate permease